MSIENVVTYSWRVSSDSFDLCNSRNVSVVVHDSVWNTDYVAALAIILETMEDDTPLENVVFRNMEICREYGRPILVNVYNADASDCMVDVLFENIRIGKGKGAVDMKFDAKNQDNAITAALKQVSVGSTLLTGDNMAEHAEILGGAVVNIP